MKAHRQKKLTIILFVAAGLTVSVGLILFAMSQNINLFYTPTQVAEGEVTIGQQIRIGGMVKEGSVVSANDSLQVRFETTDFIHAVPIEYEGILPDLFREGQGIVAEGTVDAAETTSRTLFARRNISRETKPNPNSLFIWGARIA